MADAKLQAVIDARDRTAGAFGSFNARIQASRNRIRGMGLAMSAMGAAMVGAMALSVKSFAAAGDEVQKMALRTGFSTEALSELRFAAQIAGTDIRSMEVGFRRMSSSIIDANAGLTESQRAFEQLGLDFTALVGLKPEDAFLKIAFALADVEDATLQVSLAQDIFSRSGTSLLPLLEGGAEGLQRLRDEAHALGQVFSLDTANQAAELNDRLTTLKASMQGVVFVLAQVMVPAIDAVVGVITPVIVGFRQWSEEHETLARVVVIAAGVVGGLMLVLGPLALILPSLIAGITAMSAAFRGLVLAMTTTPIGLILTGISVLVGLLAADWIKGFAQMKQSTEDTKRALSELAVTLTRPQVEMAKASLAQREWEKTILEDRIAQLQAVGITIDNVRAFDKLQKRLREVNEEIMESRILITEAEIALRNIVPASGEAADVIGGLTAAVQSGVSAFREMGPVAAMANERVSEFAQTSLTVQNGIAQMSGSLDDATEATNDATKRAALSAAVQAGIVSDLASTYRVAITASELMGRTITSVMQEAEQAAALSGSSITDVLEGMMRAFKSVEEQAAESVESILASMRALSGGGGFTAAGFQQFLGGFSPLSLAAVGTGARSPGASLLALSQARIEAAAPQLDMTPEQLVDALNRGLNLPVLLDGQRVGDVMGSSIATRGQIRDS